MFHRQTDLNQWFILTIAELSIKDQGLPLFYILIFAAAAGSLLIVAAVVMCCICKKRRKTGQQDKQFIYLF